MGSQPISRLARTWLARVGLALVLITYLRSSHHYDEDSLKDQRYFWLEKYLQTEGSSTPQPPEIPEQAKNVKSARVLFVLIYMTTIPERASWILLLNGNRSKIMIRYIFFSGLVEQ